jgi:hypothetical protein
LIPDDQPILVFPDKEHPKKPFLQWAMKTEKSVGVVDEGTYIHIFQLSKGQDEHPLSKVAVARGNDTPMVLFSYDALDPDATFRCETSFRFKYSLA